MIEQEIIIISMYLMNIYYRCFYVKICELRFWGGRRTIKEQDILKCICVFNRGWHFYLLDESEQLTQYLN